MLRNAVGVGTNYDNNILIIVIHCYTHYCKVQHKRALPIIVLEAHHFTLYLMLLNWNRKYCTDLENSMEIDRERDKVTEYPLPGYNK